MAGQLFAPPSRRLPAALLQARDAGHAAKARLLGLALSESAQARTAFGGQQTDEPLEGDRRDYLFTPLDEYEDHGFRGPFGDESHGRSPQLALTTHRLSLAGVLAGAAAVASVAASRRYG